MVKEILVERREVLIKSTLCSIPAYFMSLLQDPGEVTENLK